MEEILASIRRIISEEDKPGDAGEVLDLKPPPAPVAEVKAPIVAPQPAPKPAPIPEPPRPAPVAAAPPPPAPAVFEEPEEIVPSRPLDDELMIVDEEPAPAPIPAPVAAVPKPAPQPEWNPPPQQPTRPLVSDPVASQTSNALGRLMGSMITNSGNTLDDVVRELLKPLLKEWLDVNLPSLVEAEVAKEIDRIRRMSR